MAILILMLATGLCASIGSWMILRILQREYVKYRATFQSETAVRLADFFLFLDPSQLWGVNVFLAITVCGLVLLTGFHPLVAALLACFSMLIPRSLLKWARARRDRQIDEQLPDFLLALAGALRAGAGLQTGLRMVAQHMQRPLAQELGLLLQQQRMGMTLVDVLDALHARISTESVGLLVAAIKVAGHTGGSLAETLERIAKTLRTRLHLLRKVRAMTSQGRMQAWIMAGLPILLIFALHSLDPQTMALLWKSPLGWGVLILVCVLECLGFFLVRRIVDIEV